MSVTAVSDHLRLFQGVLDPRVLAALNSIPYEKRPDIAVILYFVRKNLPFRLNVATGEIAVETEGGGMNTQSRSMVLKKGMRKSAADRLRVSKKSQPPPLREKNRGQRPVSSLAGKSKPMNIKMNVGSSSPSSDQKMSETGSADGNAQNSRFKRGRKRGSPLTVNTDIPSSSGQSSGSRRQNVSTLSPKRYNTKVRKVHVEPPTVDAKGNPLRRSERCVAKRNAESADKESKEISYEDRAAPIPDPVDPSTLNYLEEREELLVNPDDTHQIDEFKLKAYIEAARAKLGVDTDAAFVHYVKHGYDFKKAMETIDDPESLPRKTLEGRNGPGIWDKDEISYLSYQLNSNRLRKSIPRMKKHLPKKTSSNCINAYYQLKPFRCTNNKKTFFCPVKAATAQKALNGDYVQSSQCCNCKDELWKKPVEEHPKEIKLCRLCGQYMEWFESMRPNAVVTPEKYDFGELECKCHAVTDDFDENKEWQRIIDNCKRANDRDVCFINGKVFVKFLHDITGKSVSPALEQIMQNSANINNIDYTKTYILVCRKGIVHPRYLINFDDVNLPVETRKSSVPRAVNDGSDSKPSASCPPSPEPTRVRRASLRDSEDVDVDYSELEKYYHITKNLKSGMDEEVKEVICQLLTNTKLQSAAQIEAKLLSVGIDAGQDFLQAMLDCRASLSSDGISELENEAGHLSIDDGMQVEKTSICDDVEANVAVPSRTAESFLAEIERNRMNGLIRTPCSSPSPRAMSPLDNDYQDTSPDIIFFGIKNEKGKITSDFDDAFRTYYDSMILHQELEAVTPAPVKEKKKVAIPFDLGVFSFLLAYFKNKKNIADTAADLKTSVETIKALVTKNNGMLSSFYKECEAAWRENNRKGKKKPDPNFHKVVGAEKPAALQESVNHNYISSLANL